MTKPPPTWLFMVLTALVGFVVMAVVVGMNGGGSTPEASMLAARRADRAPPALSTRYVASTQEPQRTDAPPAVSGIDYLALKAEAEERLKALLKDDHGVRYNNVQTRLSTMDGAGVIAFCGEINARNGFGAYSGFQRFVAAPSVAATEEAMTYADFDKIWQRFCIDGVKGPQVWY